MESKLEAEREQWNMHRCWDILLLYWDQWGWEGGVRVRGWGSEERKSFRKGGTLGSYGDSDADCGRPAKGCGGFAPANNRATDLFEWYLAIRLN